MVSLSNHLSRLPVGQTAIFGVFRVFPLIFPSFDENVPAHATGVTALATGPSDRATGLTARAAGVVSLRVEVPVVAVKVSSHSTGPTSLAVKVPAYRVEVRAYPTGMPELLVEPQQFLPTTTAVRVRTAVIRYPPSGLSTADRTIRFGVRLLARLWRARHRPAVGQLDAQARLRRASRIPAIVAALVSSADAGNRLGFMGRSGRRPTRMGSARCNGKGWVVGS